MNASLSTTAVQIAPSVLSADFAHLGRDVAAVERGGADLIHVDVMDGHFVPNITIGVPVVKSLASVATRPLDVHLMIEQPDRFIDDFAKAGAAMISVHVETVPHLQRTLALIRSTGALAGAVLTPSTPAIALEDVLDDLDFVLVMSVNPGFSGQSFIPNSLDKLRRVADLLARSRRPIPIEIDGGVVLDNVGQVVEAGARIIVAGNAVYGAPDPAAAVAALRAAGTLALPR